MKRALISSVLALACLLPVSAQDQQAPLDVGETTFVKKDTVLLRALDKITGRSTDFEMRVGEPKVYGSLRVALDRLRNACW
ncbi:MAG: DUF2155 domain-containing protein [Alphaproteobacteria bacterium]|nr:DUF2155 domain-containing protein [Alphaproteobacteria bacterium]